MWNSLAAVLILASFATCQTPEKGWKGIKPLSTGKIEVDNLLGQPEVDDNGYQMYKSAQAFVQINYSSKPCAPDQYDRGLFKVPEGTVLEYKVRLQTTVRLRDLKLDLSNYHRESGHVSTSADYVRAEKGIRIGVYIQEGIEYLAELKYSPDFATAKRLACKHPSSKNP